MHTYNAFYEILVERLYYEFIYSYHSYKLAYLQ